MKQLTLRLPEQLADRLKSVAAERGESVNTYAATVLSAAVDPDTAGDEAARLRERLARAGLLERWPPPDQPRPPAAEVEKARREAGRGTMLSDLVSEGRR